MKRYLTHALGLVLIVAGLTADGQFAQFPNDATKFLSGANSWAVPGTFGAITATTGSFSGAVTNGSTVGVAGATTLASTLAVSGRTTLNAGLILAPTTLVTASAVTNYGIDMALWPSGYKSMANHVTFTGITNNAAGAQFEAILYNGSGGALVVRVPTGGLYSTSAGVSDWSSDAGGRYLTVTNTWTVKVRADGMGTASSNALWTATWYLP